MERRLDESSKMKKKQEKESQHQGLDEYPRISTRSSYPMGRVFLEHTVSMF